MYISKSVDPLEKVQVIHRPPPDGDQIPRILPNRPSTAQDDEQEYPVPVAQSNQGQTTTQEVSHQELKEILPMNLCLQTILNRVRVLIPAKSKVPVEHTEIFKTGNDY